MQHVGRRVAAELKRRATIRRLGRSSSRAAAQREVRRAASASVELLERRCLLSAGDLDPTFGAGGVAQLPNAFAASAVAVQPDGKLLVGASVNGSNFALFRLNADGSADSTFGSGGLVTVPVTMVLRPTCVVVQPDGKVLEAGCNPDSFNDGTILARFNADGSMDASFGSGGVVQLPTSALPVCDRLALEPDGKILLAGGYEPSAPTNFDAVIARLNPDGSLDTTFGTGGLYDWPATTMVDRADSFYVYPDGSFLAAGFQGDGTSYWIRPFDAAGLPSAQLNYSPHSTLGQSWNIDSDVHVAVQSDGRVVLGARSQGAFIAMRFKADLSGVDTTFGTNGWTMVGFSGGLRGSATALAAGDQLVAAGASGQHAAVARFNVNGGGGDGNFGVDGLAAVPLGTNDAMNDVVVLPDNSIVAVGSTGSSAAVVRLVGGPATVPDIEFSPSGVLTFNGTRGADNLHLSLANGVYTATFNGLTETFDASNVSSVSASLGGGADVVQLDGVTCPGSVDLGDGANVVTVNASPAGAAGWSFVGGAGNDTLNVNAGAPPVTFDGGGGSGDAVTFTGSASADTISATGTSMTGTAGGAPISLSYTNVETINVYGGANLDNIAATGDAQHQFYLSGDDDNDTIAFHSPAGALPATIHGGNGDDAILVDAGLNNPVQVFGDAGSDTVTVKGTAGDDVINATRTSVNAVAISAENLAVDGGDGNDVITFIGDNTGKPTLLGGNGDDRLVFDETNQTGQLVNKSAADGGAGNDTLVYDRHTATIGQSYSLLPVSSDLFGSTALLTVGSNTANVTSVEVVDLLTGDGADSIQVGKSLSGGTVNVDMGGGDDTISFGYGGQEAYMPATQLIVHGGGGNDHLGIDDSFRATALTVSVTARQIGLAPGDSMFTGGGGITYDGIDSISVKTGTGADLIRVSPDGTPAVTVHAQTPSTSPGDRLVVDTARTTGVQQTITGTGAGTFTFTNAPTLTYDGVESASTVAGPAATGASIVAAPANNGITAYSMAFDSDLNATGLSPSVLQVQDLSTGALIPSSALAANYDANSRTITWTFPGMPGGVLGPSAYRMMLSAGSISSTQGDLLLSDARFDVIPVQPARQPGVQWTVLRPLLDPSGLLLSLSPDAQYSVAGGSSTTAPTLTVSAGLVALTDDLSRTFGSGGGAPVVVTGGRLVLLGSQVFKSLSIDNGAVSLAGGPAAQLTLVGPLSITATGTLDLGSAGLLLPTSANANIGAYLAQAAGPALPDGEHTWTGTGLTSSVVEADAANGNPKALALGYFDSRDDAQTGLSVRTGQTLVKVTVYGDATGDGINDTADFTIWRNNFFKGNRWSQGDFNYDGVIDTADFTIWRNNFFKHASGPTAGGATAAAPLAVSVGGSAAAAAGTSASAISSQAVAVAAASPAQAAPHARHSTAVCNGGAGRIPSVAHASSPLPRAPFSVTPIGDSAEAAPSAPASAAAFGGGAVSDASRGAAFEAHRRRVRGVL